MLIRAVRALLGGAALAIGLFMLAGWIGSSIPRNAGWRESPDGIEIMVESNGVHTGIVMPLVTPEKDWRATFPAAHLAAPDRPYTHISVSWGEAEVFLNTPTWADLSPRTVLRIIGTGGKGVLHVAHYVRPMADKNMRPITLTPAEYRRLITRIERLAPGPKTARHRGYGDGDLFYDAPEKYTIFNTCNQWSSDMLAAAGIRTGWWTPFAGGVMKWVPRHRPPTGQMSDK